MRRFVLAGVAALSLAAVPAFAQGPLLHPSRDVAVVYHVEGTPAAGGPAQAHTIRMFWGKGGEALRVELDGQPIVALIDFKRQRMEMVISAKQMVLDAALDPRLVPGFVIPDGASAVRGGTDTVAGQGCAVWKLTGPQGGGTACVTTDGVVLRAEGSAAHEGAGQLEAVSVTYAPQPASLFTPPAGFRRMDVKPPRQ